MALYPFVPFDLPLDAPQERFDERRRELILRFPPDREPRLFALIEDAWQHVRTLDARVTARLTWAPTDPRKSLEDLQYWLTMTSRVRAPDTDRLASLVAENLVDVG